MGFIIITVKYQLLSTPFKILDRQGQPIYIYLCNQETDLKQFQLQAMNVQSLFSLPLLFLLLFLLNTAHAQLHVEYYRSSCPNVEAIVHAAVKQKFQQTFVTAPATLRLFFHDCFIRVLGFFS